MSERNSRITSYKKAAEGVPELRRKRVELSVALRKQARDEQLLKRRALSPGDETLGDILLSPQPSSNDPLPSPTKIVQGLKSAELPLMTSSARAARRLLSREQNPPISVMVEAGVIKPLVDALVRDDCADLQFEAAWALTNIASGTHEQTMAVVEGDAIPRLVTLLSQGGAVGEQSAWALGNIAGDGPATRDAVLAHGALPALLPALCAQAPPTRLRTAVWTYSNLCRNKNPLVNFDLVAPAIPCIADLLEIDDKDVLADACWALSYLTDGPNDRIERVQTAPQLLPRLVALLDHAAAAVKTPALRAVGNMLTGSDEQTDRCLDAGCLEALARLLACNKAGLVKEAAWAASNVLAGTPAQIQRAVQARLLPCLRNVIENGEPRCQKEAAWAVSNLCLGGGPEQLDALLGCGLLAPYCALLAAVDHKTVSVVLDGVTNLLQAADRYGQVEPLCIKLEEIGALDKIESLQHHENESIYKKVVNIMDTYFAETEDQLAPAQANDEEYQFGAQPPPTNLQF